jgi:hypothetical protein
MAIHEDSEPLSVEHTAVSSTDLVCSPRLIGCIPVFGGARATPDRVERVDAGAQPAALWLAGQVAYDLKLIDAAVPKDLDLHLVLDKYATHKTPAIHQWVSRQRETEYLPSVAGELWPGGSPRRSAMRSSGAQVGTRPSQ